MDWRPLFNIPKALAQADWALESIVYDVERLHAETDGWFPAPAETQQLLANVAAIRELLALVIPPTLQETITEEHRKHG